MTNWVDPYPDQAGCAWAKQRAKEMKTQKEWEALFLQQNPPSDSIIKTKDNA